MDFGGEIEIFFKFQARFQSKKRCFAAVGRWGLAGGPASSVTMGIIIVIDQLSSVTMGRINGIILQCLTLRLSAMCVPHEARLLIGLSS